MSDEAIGPDDWGGDEPVSRLLPAGDYDGTITVAAWGKADWAERKYPESGGVVLKVKVEIDSPEGYAEAWATIPRLKSRRWQVRLICKAAGVAAPEPDSAWGPGPLVGKSVRVTTSIYTNERTGESKVQIDKWLEGGPRETVVKGFAPEPAAKPAARTPKQKVEAAGQGGQSDDIPF